jgi:hypothetical protein
MGYYRAGFALGYLSLGLISCLILAVLLGVITRLALNNRWSLKKCVYYHSASFVFLFS